MRQHPRDQAAQACATKAAEQPTSSPMELATLLNGVGSFIGSFLVLGPEQVDALALWIMMTHSIEAFDIVGYINITSAEKQSGKTRLLEVLCLVVARPWLTAKTSAAALVRKAGECPTLLLDETDAAFGGEREYAETLRGVLNAGYKRGGSVTLCVGRSSDIKTRDFAVFCPKAFAGIGRRLPSTVADRSIRIEMKRKRRGETVQRFRGRDAAQLAKPLHEALAAWASRLAPALRDARPDLPEELDDRAAEVWEPLFAIAGAAGGDWPIRARRAALALSAGKVMEDDSPGVRLLVDIRDVFESRCVGQMPTADLIKHLCGIEEAPWATWRHEKPITPAALAALLRDFGVRPVAFRAGRDTDRGYRLGDFADAFERYVPRPIAPKAQQAQQEEKTAGLPCECGAQQPSSVAPPDGGANVMKQGTVAHVAPTGSAAEGGYSVGGNFPGEGDPAYLLLREAGGAGRRP